MSYISELMQKAKAEPDKSVLCSLEEDREVTFRELFDLSGRVYRYLKDRGIGREDFVNIVLPRSVDPFIAMVGVWRAGAAFVAMEEDLPEERKSYIRKDCGCKLILDRAVWEEVLLCEPLDGFEETDVHDAAFAVYTSGSTGNPKGVLHEYGNLDILKYDLGDNPYNLHHYAAIAPLDTIAPISSFIGNVYAGEKTSLVPFAMLKNPPAVISAFVEHNVDSMFCPPSLMRLFRSIPTVRNYYIGSEMSKGIWSDDPEIRIINSYGASETGFCVTKKLLTEPYETAPIGRPVTDMKITIRDEDGNPVPDGQVGELCVEDPFVRGYINLPEETERAFYNGEYHTRDLARRLPDGDYVIVGRVDEMIKISGNRVEPAEIEMAVSKVTGLEQVVVRGFGQDEDAYIACYYADPVEIDPEEVREKLSDIIPSYMIPSHFIHLDELPRIGNGKVSRKLLPEPVKEGNEYIGPENETERILCETMARVLKKDRFSATDDFYQMGGTSVTSMELVGLSGLAGLTISQIFRGRSPRKIADYYLKERASSNMEEGKGSARDYTIPVPLTQAQLGIYLECEKRAGEAVYNNPMLLRFIIDPVNDPDRLADAVERTMKAHPGLFSAVVSDEKGLPAMRYEKAYEDQTICVREQMSEEELQGIKALLVQPFDVKGERLFRIRLIETEAARYLFMDFHHLIIDGTSMQIIFSELDRALKGGDIEREAWTAYDAAADQQDARRGERWEDARDWYLKEFDCADTVSLPQGDRKEKEVRYGDMHAALDLSAFCKKNHTTENVAALAAFGYLLSALSLKKEALFSTVYNGRQDPRTEGTVSMFVSTLPVLCRVEKDMQVTDYLACLQGQLIGAMANDIYSFADLAADTGITGDVQFIWQADLHEVPENTDLRMTGEELFFVATGQILNAELYTKEGQLILHLQYRADMYSREYMERFAKSLGNILKDMMVKDRLRDVSLLDDAEKEEILKISTGDRLDYDRDQTWLDLFLDHVKKNPDKTAVVDSLGSYTYRELDQASDRIAAYLLDKGVEKDSFVAIKMGRVKEFAASVTGIHKAGAAYVPVDPDYPKERIAYMLEDSMAKVVLTEEVIEGILSEAASILSEKASSIPEPVLNLSGTDSDEKSAVAADENKSSTKACGEDMATEGINLARPEGLAYMIYTSGSSGQPKGAMNRHSSLMNYTEVYVRRFEITPQDRISHHITWSFDAHIRDLFPALAGGAGIYIMPESIRREPDQIMDFLERYRISGGSYATAMGQLLLTDYHMKQRYISVGGEALMGVKAEGIKVFNTYGATESADTITDYILEDGVWYDSVPIGKALPNCHAFIVDSHGHLLPRGMAGEICYGGPHVGAGYWNQPEMTAEVFTDCPFLPGERMYHSGDLGRYNEKGDLEYLGRIDHQVKLRGYRIELGEIEACASGYPGIAQVAALVVNDQLVLYYTGSGTADEDDHAEIDEDTHAMIGQDAHAGIDEDDHAEIDEDTHAMIGQDAYARIDQDTHAGISQDVHARIDQDTHAGINGDSHTEIDRNGLRNYLAERLTGYMVPDIYMQLKEMPETPNGKIDRRKLPEPDLFGKEEFVLAETETEEKVCRIVESLLNTDKISVMANLVSCGLSSIGAMRLAARISNVFPAGISVADIMKEPDIRRIAARIDRGDMDVPDGKGITAYPRQDLYPITENQRGIFIDWQMHPGTTQYNVPAVRLYEDTAGQSLVEAVRSVIDAHSILKAGFEYADGDVMMRRKDDLPARVSCTELDHEPDTAFFQSLVRPFDLLKDSLYRVEVYSFGGKSWLFADIHHIIYDGLSGVIFFREIREALDGGKVHQEEVTAFDYALYEKELEGSEAFTEAKVYFEGLLTDAEPARLPAGKKQDGRAGCRCLASMEAEAVDAFCRKVGVTAGSFLQAAFAETLKRISLEEKVMYATVSNGRSAGTALEKSIGMFVKTLPVVSLDSKDLSSEAYVREFHRQLQASYEREYYPYTRLVEDTGLKAEFMFVYQGGLLEGADGVADSEISRAMDKDQLSLDTSKLTVDVNVFPEGDRYGILVEYNGNTYGRNDIKRFISAFVNEAKGLTQKEYVREVSLADEREEETLLKLSAGDRLDYDRNQTWLDLFLDHAGRMPDKTAVVDSRGTYSYGELDQASDRIAAYLLDKGVEADSFVAIKMGRAKEFAAAVIGIHKAGAAYVPLDPDYPEKRIAYMLEDSMAKVVLTEEVVEGIIRKGEELVEETLTGAGSVQFEPDKKAAETVGENKSSTKERGENPVPDGINLSKPDGRAYMIYTSGTTGEAKGVIQSHRSLRAFTAWRLQALGIDENSIHASCTSFSFDASLDDLICPLAAGGQVHILSEELRTDMAGMKEYFDKHHITGLTMPTRLGMAMVDQYPDMSLSFLMMGGEKMLPCRKTGIRLINGYGPTEFTVCSSYHVVDQDKDTGDIPIGRPVPNTWSFICDDYGNLLPQGVTGELCLAGSQIAEGYWRQEDLTKEKFVSGTFSGMKMYRTGDLARYNEDGEIEFLGRMDSQVKLRGYRIEPGEVEACAARFEGISQTAAEVRKDQLILYYTIKDSVGYGHPADGHSADDHSADGHSADRESAAAIIEGYLTSLKSFMEKNLPSYMVPSVFYQLDEMPMTPGGKIDRDKLPDPGSAERERILPETEKERILYEIGKTILGTGQFGVTDSMQELGLTSMDAIRMAALADKAGIRLRVDDIFRAGTIRKLAAMKRSLACFLTDEPEGKEIAVLIHGFTSYLQIKPQIDALTRQGYAVFAFEPIPAHKQIFEGGETQKDVVELYMELLDLYIPEDRRISLFAGHSFGGMLAYLSAVRWEQMRGYAAPVLMYDSDVSYKSMSELLPDQPEGFALSEDLADESDLPENMQEMLEMLEMLKIQKEQSLILEKLDDGSPLPTYKGDVTWFKAVLLPPEAERILDEESLIRARISIMQKGEEAEQAWRTLIPGIHVIPVEADHFSMLRIRSIRVNQGTVP